MKNLTRWIKRMFHRNSTKELPLIMGAEYEPQQFGQPVERSLTSPIRNTNPEKYFRPSCIPIKNTLLKDFQFFDPFYEKSLRK
ncbi:hypothetical protein ACQ0QQ_16845 [Lysinibacillus sphaericus]